MEARDEAGRLKRASLRHAVPWARSVVVCAINYNTAQPYSTEVNDSQRGWISRYAWGEDYHDAVMAKLRVVEQQLHQESGEQRSEERRVGKELRARRWTESEKENRKKGRHG